MSKELPKKLEIKHKDAFLFEGVFDGIWEMKIEKEIEKDDTYYIEVWDEDGYAYDGYWHDLKNEGMRGAIFQALSGACLYES